MTQALEVVAINNEKMYLPVSDVRMVGPLMDRGLAMLGRSVIYVEGLPPLPVKESRAELVARLGWEVSSVAEGEGDSGAADGSPDGGSEGGSVEQADGAA